MDNNDSKKYREEESADRLPAASEDTAEMTNEKSPSCDPAESETVTEQAKDADETAESTENNDCEANPESPKETVAESAEEDTESAPDDIKTEDADSASAISEESNNTSDEADAKKAESAEAEAEDGCKAEAESKTEPEADPEVDPDEIEDEPFVKKYNPERDRAIAEIAAYAERITGAPHSVTTTAAPIRTRTPEQNRNIDNGIASRRSPAGTKNATVPRPNPHANPRGTTQNRNKSNPHPESADKKDGGSVKLLTAIVASMIVIAGILSTIVIVVNTIYSKNRPADFDLSSTMPEDTELITLDTSKKPDRDPIVSESDSAETADGTSDITSESGETDEASSETETEPAREQQYTVVLDFFDHEDIELSTAKITLGELLKSINYTLPEYEVPEISLDALIASDITIKINRHEYRTETVTETIPFETEVYETDLVWRGSTNCITEGAEGEKTLSYTVEYLNGEEKNRTLNSENVTKQPITAKYEKGVGGSFMGADGITYTYAMRKIVPATYYNIEGLTYLGTMADESVIAVDMNVMPLGTKVYVKNAEYDFGVRIASDIGGGVKGDLIDIWIAEDNPQLESFAFKGYHYDMEIYYIDE